MKNMLGEELTLQEAIKDTQQQLRNLACKLVYQIQEDYKVGVTNISIPMINASTWVNASWYECGNVKLEVEF